MDILHDLLICIGRLFISALFIWAAVSKLTHWKESLAHIHTKKIPHASLLLSLAILAQIAGGLSLVLGYQTKLGALLLICVTLPAMLKMHDFWNVAGPQNSHEKAFFMKDLAIVSALVLLIAVGAGSFSFDGQ